MTTPQGRTDTPGRGSTYSVTGRDLVSVSTIAKQLPNTAIKVWEQKRIAYGVAVDRHIRALAENEDTVYQAVRHALDSSPSPEADLGTEVHAATELYDRFGTMQAARAVVQPYLDQWIDARVEFGIECVAIEQTVADLSEDGYAGTLDRIITLAPGEVPPMAFIGGDEPARWACGPTCESPNHVADIKTGKGIYPDIAIQLSAYARAPHFWTPGESYGEGELTDRVKTCTQTGLGIWLHADFCRLVPVDIATGWQAWKAARMLQDWAEVTSWIVSDALPRRVTGGRLSW